MHKSVLNNMIIQLRGNAFGIHDTAVEPMSRHKWRTVKHVAKEIGISPYIDAPLEVEPEYDVSQAQMFNFLTDRKFIGVKDAEMDSENVSEDTLRMLEIIVTNANAIIQKDIDIKGILALGVFMQRHKDSIDYEKLNGWIMHLGLASMASFMGSIITDTFHLPQNEVGIIFKHNKKADKVFKRALEKSIVKHSASFFLRIKLAPIETISYNFFHAITKITDIEE